ncbi:hypothetical protein SCHIN_v1c05980 [Spiroplasma chinense]|uniref:Lipoprotein n=1 Tax=Spiroplasma chinense TaxID=216932 RepID=A0A5B9Y4R3_9MOLU|nr:hypothetical protein [Spiroplasma chinense]QEH61795.1 hypothetical protein SCHIN_v1c05980 [Spiroplasma chinense]
MKKLLAIMASTTVGASCASNVVSCDPGETEIYAEAGSKLESLFNEEKATVQINQKNIQGLIDAIKKLNIINHQQYIIEGEIKSDLDTGKVKLLPNEDFFIKVEGQVEITWIYHNGQLPEPNPGGENSDNNLHSIQNKFDSNAGFNFNVNSVSTDPVAGWKYIRGTVIGVFNEIVGESFGIPESERYEKIKEYEHYECNYDEVVATKELIPGQKIYINFWSLDGSWLNGEAIITITLN